MRNILRALFSMSLFVLAGCTGSNFKSASLSLKDIAKTEVPDDGTLGVPVSPPPPESVSKFLVGYNEAWFGQYFQNSFTDGFSESAITKSLSDMKASGASVVRLWFFQNRQGIVLSNGAPRTVGIESRMLTNIEKTMAIARALNIKIYFTLWDGNVMPKENSELRDYYYNLLNNKYGEGDAFNTTVLTPVLALLNENKDVVYALDLMNEIQAPMYNGYWSALWDGPRGWIQSTRNFVKSKSSWLKVTSSAGWGWAAYDITRGLFSGLGLDFYDLHVYDDNGNIPSVTNVCATAKKDGVPIILGEFGQATKNDDDNLQKTSTQNFLNNAKNTCFSGALAWRFDAAEETWRFQRADGSFRPAVEVMKNFK